MAAVVFPPASPSGKALADIRIEKTTGLHGVIKAVVFYGLLGGGICIPLIGSVVEMTFLR